MREETEGSRSLWRVLALTICVAAVVVVEQSFLILPPWLGFASLAVVLSAVFCVAPDGPRMASAGGRWALVAAGFAFAVGVFFRLRYLTVVPSGWGNEPLAFVRFAQQLVDEGFPYMPYSWYAHTLYSYLIALVMLVVPSDLMAFRIASAAISVATLAALFLAVRLLLGIRVAAAAVALLASSYWHLFASRNGYHQQLLPLFQSLFLYGLGAGLLRDQFRGWLIAAAAMVAGLHAHWGFYLMPVYWAAVFAYLWLLHGRMWRRQARSTFMAALVAAVWASPLALFFYYNTQSLDYVFRGFTLGASAAPDLASKIGGNLRYIGWALSGNPLPPVEFGTQVDPLVAAAALAGLVVSVRWFVRSIPHALLVLLLMVNLAGLTVTLANIFYITATLVAVYSLAAVGLVAIVDEVEKHQRRLMPLAAVVLAVVLGWQATRNYDEFFAHRIFSELREPHRSPGTFFLLFDSIRESLGRRSVFIARDEPGRDFDAPVNAVAKQTPSFAFVADTGAFDVEMILFPKVLVGDAEGVDIWVPNLAVVEESLIPSLRRFYPDLDVTAIEPPMPYAAKDSTAVAYRLSIARADVAAYHGLRDGKGFVYMPADGRYHFRRTAVWRGEGSILIHDEAVDFDEDSSRGLLLEKGLHPVRVTNPEMAVGVEVRVGVGEWKPLEDFLLNSNGHAEAELAPYIARPGKVADFVYQQRVSLPRPGDVRAVEVEADGKFVTAAADAVRWHAAGGTVERELAVTSGVPVLLRRTSAGLLRIDQDGTWWNVEPEKFTRRGVVGCAPAEVLAGDPPLIICRNGELRALDAQSRAPDSAHSGAKIGVVSDATAFGEEVMASDEQSGRLWRLDKDGEVIDRHAMAGIYWGSDIETDPFGNLHIKRWGCGLKSYSPDGYLLFHPTTDRPALFMRGAELDADVSPMRRFRFRGEHAVAIGLHEFVYRFERIELP